MQNYFQNNNNKSNSLKKFVIPTSALMLHSCSPNVIALRKIESPSYDLFPRYSAQHRLLINTSPKSQLEKIRNYGNVLEEFNISFYSKLFPEGQKSVDISFSEMIR